MPALAGGAERAHKEAEALHGGRQLLRAGRQRRRLEGEVVLGGLGHVRGDDVRHRHHRQAAVLHACGRARV